MKKNSARKYKWIVALNMGGGGGVKNGEDLGFGASLPPPFHRPPSTDIPRSSDAYMTVFDRSASSTFCTFINPICFLNVQVILLKKYANNSSPSQ